MCVAPIVLCARANSPSPCRKLRQFGPANVERARWCGARSSVGYASLGWKPSEATGTWRVSQSPAGARRVSRRLLRADDGEFCGKGLVVRLGGLEPPTSGSTIRRSNQLSYNRTSLPGTSPPDAASAFTDEALPHLAAQYGQSADISRLLRLASTRPVDDVRRGERRCDGCNQGKEKGRGRRSGLFPMNGQREEVLA